MATTTTKKSSDSYKRQPQIKTVHKVAFRWEAQGKGRGRGQAVAAVHTAERTPSYSVPAPVSIQPVRGSLRDARGVKKRATVTLEI